MVAARMMGKYVDNGFSLSLEYCKRGTLKADEGKLTEALENFNKAIDLYPLNSIAYYNRATVRMDLGDIAGARNDFETSGALRVG
jgi:Flp pilus assembly protein TadD